MAHFTPTVADLITENIFELHGVPKGIISDVIRNSRLGFEILCWRLWKPKLDSAQLFVQNWWTNTTPDPDSWDYAEALRGRSSQCPDQVPTKSRVCLQICCWKVSILTGLRKKPWFTDIYRPCAESQVNATRTLLKSLHAAWAAARGTTIQVEKESKSWTLLDWILSSRIKTSSRDLWLKLPPGSRMHPFLYVGWMQPHYASEALAPAPNFKEDSACYSDFSDKASEKIVEKKVTGQGARSFVKRKHTSDHDSTWFNLR